MKSLGLLYIRTDSTRNRFVVRVPQKKSVTVNLRDFGSSSSALDYAINVRNKLIRN
jgi:hypothetical protein